MIVERDITAHDAEAADEESRGFLIRRRRFRVGRGRQRELAEIQGAVTLDQHPRERLFQQDRLEVRPEPPDACVRQIDEEMAEGEHRLPISVG